MHKAKCHEGILHNHYGEAQVTNLFQIERRRLTVKDLSAERKIPNKKRDIRTLTAICRIRHGE